MKTSDIVKWLAIAGAAYLLYRYLQQQGVLGAPPAPAQLPSGDTVAPPDTATPPAKPTDFAAVTRNSLFAFAQGKMGATWDGRLSIGEWNWMVSKLTGVDQQRDLLNGGADPGLIYAEEYLSRRTGAGISGLKQAFGEYTPMASGWSM